MENLTTQPADSFAPICRYDSLDDKPQIFLTLPAHMPAALTSTQPISIQRSAAGTVSLVPVVQPTSPVSAEPISYLSLWHKPLAAPTATATPKAQPEAHPEAKAHFVQRQTAPTAQLKERLKAPQQPQTAPTALKKAVCANDLATVEALLSAKVSLKPAHWYDTPLLVHAAERGYNDIVQALLNAGDDPNKGYLRLPLHVAAEHGHLETVQRLLNSGAQLHAKEEEGQTALMRAAANGHLPIVQVLIDKGANINDICRGETALMLASRNGHREVYEFLYPYVRARGMLVEEQALQQQAIFSAEAAHFDSELADLFGGQPSVRNRA